jgi:hypothetical protein
VILLRGASRGAKSESQETTEGGSLTVEGRLGVARTVDIRSAQRAFAETTRLVLAASRSLRPISLRTSAISNRDTRCLSLAPSKDLRNTNRELCPQGSPRSMPWGSASCAAFSRADPRPGSGRHPHWRSASREGPAPCASCRSSSGVHGAGTVMQAAVWTIAPGR